MIGSKHSCDHVESSICGPARYFLTARVKKKKKKKIIAIKEDLA